MHEYRVGLTSESVRELVHHGHITHAAVAQPRRPGAGGRYNARWTSPRESLPRPAHGAGNRTCRPQRAARDATGAA